MIIFHLTIYMIHYLYFFVFYGWFLNFFENGMDAATVMEITGLTESQLQQLKV